MKKLFLVLLAIIPSLLFAQVNNNTDTLVSGNDQGPTYNGGFQKMFQYIAMNMKYPDSARDNNLTGIVYVTFVVEPNGKTHDYKVSKGVYPCLDREALRIAESIPEDWSPRIINGDTVSSIYTLPISFMLQ